MLPLPPPKKADLTENDGRWDWFEDPISGGYYGSRESIWVQLSVNIPVSSFLSFLHFLFLQLYFVLFIFSFGEYNHHTYISNISSISEASTVIPLRTRGRVASPKCARSCKINCSPGVIGVKAGCENPIGYSVVEVETNSLDRPFSLANPVRGVGPPADDGREAAYLSFVSEPWSWRRNSLASLSSSDSLLSESSVRNSNI